MVQQSVEVLQLDWERSWVEERPQLDFELLGEGELLQALGARLPWAQG